MIAFTQTPAALTATLLASEPRTAALCVLCERTTLVALPWNGTSACCRHCYRAHKHAVATKAG